MFCSTLRRRQSCAPLVPVITARDGLNLKESLLETHDLCIPLPSSTSQLRTLRLLFLTALSITPNLSPATLSRIQHFAALTGGTDIALVLLLDPSPQDSSTSMAANTLAIGNGTSSTDETRALASVSSSPPDARASAYAQLATALHPSDAGLPSIPILPLATAAALPQLLNTYVQSLTASSTFLSASSAVSGAPTRAPSAALDLLPYCTAADAPMKPQTLYVLTDLFPSLRDVAEAVVASITGADAGAGVGLMEGGKDGETLDRVDSGRAGDGYGGRSTTRAEEVRRAEEGLGVLYEYLGTEEAQAVVEFWREEWIAE